MIWNEWHAVKQEGGRWQGSWLSDGKQIFSTEQIAWRNAGHRCRGTTDKNKRHYTDRGIKRLISFQGMMDEIGLKPGPQYTLDRIDNGGHYESGNIRWATYSQQSSNRRHCSTCSCISEKGEDEPG